MTSPHDWCDRVYPINIGILAHFLHAPRLHHPRVVFAAVKQQRKWLQTMKNIIREAIGAALLPLLNIAVSGVKADDFSRPFLLELVDKIKQGCNNRTLKHGTWDHLMYRYDLRINATLFLKSCRTCLHM